MTIFSELVHFRSLQPPKSWKHRLREIFFLLKIDNHDSQLKARLDNFHLCTHYGKIFTPKLDLGKANGNWEECPSLAEL